MKSSVRWAISKHLSGKPMRPLPRSCWLAISLADGVAQRVRDLPYNQAPQPSRMPSNRIRLAVSIGLSLPPLPLVAQTADTARVGQPTAACPSCAEWNAPQRPSRIYGNTYYVGT